MSFRMDIFSLALIWALFLHSSHGLNNNRGLKPTMGWDAFVVFSCDVDENKMHKQVDAMVSSGLRDAGYNTFILACGWQATDRGSNGEFQINSKAFPGGMDGMAKYLHDRRMQFGLTSTVGSHACGTKTKAHDKLLGAEGHEVQDVQTFARWGIDFLKMEFCWADNPHMPIDYNPTFSVKDRFALTRDALKKVNRPITYGISAWGIQDPLSWPVNAYANQWRIGDDVSGKQFTWAYIVRTINQFAALSWANAPGTFSDLDLLEIGQGGATKAEAITQFTFWAAAKSPLILSTDVTSLNPALITYLKNKDVIGINQDPLGASIRLRRRYTEQHDIWSGPLKDGSVVVVIVNFISMTLQVTFNLADVGLASANIVDVWANDDLGQRNTSIVFPMSGHGVQLLKLTAMVSLPPVKYQYYPAIGVNCDLYGQARKRTTGLHVDVASNVGLGSYVQWHDIDAGETGGRRRVVIDYITADSELVVLTNCPRCREAYISCNDGPNIKLNFPSSGGSWDAVYSGYLIELDGFTTGTTNKIKIFNDDDLAPDFVSIGIEKV